MSALAQSAAFFFYRSSDINLPVKLFLHNSALSVLFVC